MFDSVYCKAVFSSCVWSTRTLCYAILRNQYDDFIQLFLVFEALQEADFHDLRYGENSRVSLLRTVSTPFCDHNVLFGKFVNENESIQHNLL